MSKEVFLHFSHRFLSMSVSPRAGGGERGTVILILESRGPETEEHSAISPLELLKIAMLVSLA